MTRLLHVQGSPRGERSRSGRIAAHFLHRRAEREPDLQVETLNVWSTDLPALGGEQIEARYALLHRTEATPAQQIAWREVIGCAEHFAGFDAFLISTPMWNFGLPYRLKHYIDLITQPGVLFSAMPEGAARGGLDGKRAWIVATSAWAYAPDGGLAHLDFQVRYLREWFAFCGLGEVAVIAAAPMFGTPDIVEAALAKALAHAEVLADAA